MKLFRDEENIEIVIHTISWFIFPYSFSSTIRLDSVEQLIEARRENRVEDIPAEYVAIEIKTPSLVGIIMWWIRKGLHYSSDYISDQIYLMYRGE